MAEINELLELANEETGALASDAARLRQVLSRLTASAVAMLLFLITLGFTLVQMRMSRGRA